jgi:hypothetical protein
VTRGVELLRAVQGSHQKKVHSVIVAIFVRKPGDWLLRLFLAIRGQSVSLLGLVVSTDV